MTAVLVVTMPSRRGELRHPLPDDPDAVCQLVRRLVPWTSNDAVWRVEVSDR